VTLTGQTRLRWRRAYLFYDCGKYLTSLRKWETSQVTMLMNKNVKGVLDDV
jgi:hypothetical protein